MGRCDVLCQVKILHADFMRHLGHAEDEMRRQACNNCVLVVTEASQYVRIGDIGTDKIDVARYVRRWHRVHACHLHTQLPQ